jgi:ribosomal protein L44E
MVDGFTCSRCRKPSGEYRWCEECRRMNNKAVKRYRKSSKRRMDDGDARAKRIEKDEQRMRERRRRGK